MTDTLDETVGDGDPAALQLAAIAVHRGEQACVRDQQIGHRGPFVQRSDSTIPAMSSTVVSGLTRQIRSTVSSRHEVATTNDSPAAS